MGSRRDFLKKGAYAAPAILTLSAAPGIAGAGSNKWEKVAKKKKAKKKKKRVKRRDKRNDG